jgi:hypothetical protein
MSMTVAMRLCRAMKPYNCECGLMLEFHGTGAAGRLARHKLSQRHKIRRKVWRILCDTNLSHMEIAAQLDLGPDEVGKFARELGITAGIDRRRMVAVSRALQEWWTSVGRLPFIRRCQKIALSVEPIRYIKKPWKIKKRVFFINGHRVACMGTRREKQHPSGRIYRYFTPAHGTGADYQVADALGSFYIFPSGLVEHQKDLRFIEKSSGPPRRIITAAGSDYSGYLDTWAPLRKPKRGSPTTGAADHLLK